MSDSMREFFKDEIQEEINKAVNKAVSNAVQKTDEQRVVKDIKSIMKTLKVTAQRAMDILEIPGSERNRYAALL